MKSLEFKVGQRYFDNITKKFFKVSDINKENMILEVVYDDDSENYTHEEGRRGVLFDLFEGERELRAGEIILESILQLDTPHLSGEDLRWLWEAVNEKCANEQRMNTKVVNWLLANT